MHYCSRTRSDLWCRIISPYLSKGHVGGLDVILARQYSMVYPVWHCIGRPSNVVGNCRGLPRLDHLGVACKELNIHSADPLQELPSFDFHFSEARDSTMDRLTACEDFRVSDTTTEKWRYINVCKAGTIQLKDVLAFKSGASLLEHVKLAKSYLPNITPLDCLSMSLTF